MTNELPLSGKPCGTISFAPEGWHVITLTFVLYLIVRNVARVMPADLTVVAEQEKSGGHIAD